MEIHSFQTSSKLDVVNDSPKERRKRKERERKKLQRNNEIFDQRAERLESGKLYERYKRDIEKLSDKSKRLEKE